MRIEWTPRAIRDIRAAYAYIVRENPSAAAALAERIVQQVETLIVASPRMGRPGRIAGTRELVVTRTRYIVVYNIDGEQINILAVIHHARD